MRMWTNRSFTRWDLWAIPGLILMITGLVLSFTSHHHIGSAILGVGLVINFAYVLRRSARDYGTMWPPR